MFAEFFAGWIYTLTSMVTRLVPNGAVDRDNAIVVDATSPGVLTVRRRQSGIESYLGGSKLDEPGLPGLQSALSQRHDPEVIVLRFPATALLERRVTLPIVAEKYLERALGYEIDRLTPFSGDEVYWSYSLLTRDLPRKHIHLQLTLIQRGGIDCLLDKLANVSAAPVVIETETSAGLRLIKLRRNGTPMSEKLWKAQSANFALCVLSVLAVMSPFLRQSLDMSKAQARIDALQPQMRVLYMLRDRIATARAAGDAVANESRQAGDPLGALAAITDLLPDDSYVTEFNLQDRKITLRGRSHSAPRLITKMSGDKKFRNPTFTDPVIRRDDLDTFSIRVNFVG